MFAETKEVKEGAIEKASVPDEIVVDNFDKGRTMGVFSERKSRSYALLFGHCRAGPEISRSGVYDFFRGPNNLPKIPRAAGSGKICST